jgi:hypothetical protein
MAARAHLNVTIYVQYIACAVLYDCTRQLPEFTADHCPNVTRHVQEKIDYERI